jgi:hypothetical protein
MIDVTHRPEGDALSWQVEPVETQLKDLIGKTSCFKGAFGTFCGK